VSTIPLAGAAPEREIKNCCVVVPTIVRLGGL
jgi:hypothetical protein